MTKYSDNRGREINRVARKAIRLIETEGFRRGLRGPGLCVWRAILMADHGDYAVNVIARCDSIICATTKMRHGYSGSNRLIIRWNCKPGRTKAEAIALLRRAIKHDVPFTHH